MYIQITNSTTIIHGVSFSLRCKSADGTKYVHQPRRFSPRITLKRFHVKVHLKHKGMISGPDLLLARDRFHQSSPHFTCDGKEIQKSSSLMPSVRVRYFCIRLLCPCGCICFSRLVKPLDTRYVWLRWATYCTKILMTFTFRFIKFASVLSSDESTRLTRK